MQEEKQKNKRDWVRHTLPEPLVEEATKRFYKRNTPYTNLYAHWRLHNNVLFVRRDLSDDFVNEIVSLLLSLDDKVYDFKLKLAIGAYLLYTISPKLNSNTIYIPNRTDKVVLRKV